jgi:hypothetical protein
MAARRHLKKHFKYFVARSNDRIEFHSNGAAVRMTWDALQWAPEFLETGAV